MKRDARTNRAKARRTALAVLVGVLILTVTLLHRPLFSGNFGVVTPGKVYRSAQPHHQLAKLIRSNHLESILNLRGGSNADDWYLNEVTLCSQAGIDFYDFPMSATARPRRRDLLTLLELFKTCRYPLLIHCKSGSDRTGLASAIYLVGIEGVHPEKALEAFTVLYGHFPIGGPERLHEPLVEYSGWLLERGLTHSPAIFRDWVEKDYRGNEVGLRVSPLLPGPRERITNSTSASGMIIRDR